MLGSFSGDPVPILELRFLIQQVLVLTWEFYLRLGVQKRDYWVHSKVAIGL